MGRIIVRDPWLLVKGVPSTLTPCEDSLAQQQQTFVPDLTYHQPQQLSGAIYYSGQTHGGSCNRGSPPVDLPGDGGGQWQGQPSYSTSYSEYATIERLVLAGIGVFSCAELRAVSISCELCLPSRAKFLSRGCPYSCSNPRTLSTAYDNESRFLFGPH